MEKLNVCLVNDSFPPAIDGVANAVTNYADIITREYGAATVVTPFYPNAQDEQFNFPVLRYPSLDTTKMVGYRAGIPFNADVMGKLTGAGFDIIHSHCPITSTMLSRSLRDSIDVPIVFTYHTKFDIDIANAIRGKLLQEEAARILVENISACDEIWTVSKGAGDNLRKLGYRGESIVMPNGVDFPRGRVPGDLIEKVAEGYDLPSGVPVFLFVGRMMWYKGLRIILDALKKLKDEGCAFRMVFVGGGTDKDEIIAYRDELQLGDCVFFCDPIHDRTLIRAWYCRADLFLFPSTFDTNGLVVREAAACALGSVLIAGSCAAEDVTDGVNGFCIEENAESMAAKLRVLIENPAEMKRIGENAQRDIYMSWEESVGRAYERYFAVIDNYKRGLYPKHEKLTDDFFRTAAEGLTFLYERREERREMLSDARAELEDMNARIEAAVDRTRALEAKMLSDWRDEQARTKFRVVSTREALLARLNAQREELLEQYEAARGKTRAQMEELIDRFL